MLHSGSSVTFGMAEILGAAGDDASVAALALQLMESSMMIKRLRQSYQEVPPFLGDISDGLDTFALSLPILENIRAQNSGTCPTAVTQCVLACNVAARQVHTAARKLELALRKSNAKGRIHTFLTQKHVLQLCDELERAKTSLILTFQLYAS